MALLYLDSYTLASTPDYRRRIEIAICDVAVDVQAEARANPPTAQEVRRSTLAHAVLNDPPRYVDRFAKAVAEETTITSLSTDVDLKTAISARWNAVAGVV